MFHKDRRNSDGHTGKCAVCRTQAQIAFQNKQKIEKPDHYKRWRKSNNYTSKYGISLEKVEEQLEKQNHVCPICECSLKLNPYAVDHCHASGKVRDILCHSCNKGLGFFYESEKALLSAISYLRKHHDSPH